MRAFARGLRILHWVEGNGEVISWSTQKAAQRWIGEFRFAIYRPHLPGIKYVGRPLSLALLIRWETSSF